MNQITATREIRGETRSARLAAKAAAGGFLAIALFQSALAFGAPLGRAAWGGGQAEIPAHLRIASGASAGLWVLAALIALGRAGVLSSPLPQRFVRRGAWVLVGILPIGALMNFASPSPWERMVWGPVALTLTWLCWIVARSEFASTDDPLGGSSQG